jgi:hypothetical protein
MWFYRGWALAGFIVTAALAANVWAAMLQRGQGWPFWLSAAAAGLILATLILFFAWTQPVNQATAGRNAPSPHPRVSVVQPLAADALSGADRSQREAGPFDQPPLFHPAR